MEKNELKAGVARMGERLNGKIEITLALTGRQDDRMFIDFCLGLKSLLPDVSVVKKMNGDRTLPGILLRSNIIYSAIPQAGAIDPFLETLALVNEPVPLLPQALHENLTRINIPTSLTLYTAVHCPHCPGMVRAMAPLAAACKNIFLTVIDGTLFPETAAEDQVMSVPCLILGKEMRWTGNVTPSEVVDMIVNQDPSKLSASSLKTILEDGKASWISSKMTEAQAIFPAFIELLIHPTWSVRLGAMVVLEEMAETAPELAAQITAPLWETFDRADTTLKGDILYALGQAGDQKIEEKIREVIPSLGDGDLKEAAIDAIEALASRS
ncbi:MAG: thioredoxin family protein [Desulfobacterium sp.]|jgi:glutaredoxin|nr:thioredoxin family protein [Desulfobacterium sp.]